MQVPKKALVFLTAAVVVAILIAFFDWNWLRGPFANYLSARLGRPVSIDGDLRVELSLKPRVVAVRIGTSVALGVAATPFAALLPLIDFGGATDADCQGLMQDAAENVQAQRVGLKVSPKVTAAQ